MNIDPKKLLSTFTADYLPSAGAHQFYAIRNRPLFTRQMVREMLTDPRITYGLYLIKGPIIANAAFKIDCQHQEIDDYLTAAVERFWRNSAERALKAIEWGFSGSEVMYRMKDGRIHFDVLKDLDPSDVSPARCHGKLVGMYVRNNHYDRQPADSGRSPHKTYNTQNQVYLGGPKAFWHVHWRERSPWWGVSRLFGVHIPYWEKWCEGGFRDIRRLWFHKNAFEGGTMYHPPGSTRDDSGTIRSNKDIAREMLEKKRTGGTLTLPNTPGGDGSQRAWEYLPAVANATPEGLLEYGRDLDTEILEAMGIPPEVVESGGDSGFGSSTGRQVPQEAFYAVLNGLVQWLIADFDAQILRPLVEINFGEGYDYEILPYPLGESPMEEEPLPGESTGENQFIEEDGEAKTQDQIDQEEADRYEKARSDALKKSFQMSVEPTGGWVTIGGRPIGNKKHVGGFPVKLSKDGKILAGGPRGLHGKHVSETKEFFSRDRRKETAKENSNHRTPWHDKYDLPDDNTSLGVAIREAAGDDYEDQAAFYKILKEVHERHKQEVAEFNEKFKSLDYDKKFYTGIDVSKMDSYAQQYEFEMTPEIKKMIEDKADTFTNQRDLKRVFESAAKERDKHLAKPGSVTKIIDRKKVKIPKENKTDADFIKDILSKKSSRDEVQNRSWSTVAKNIADTLGISTKDVEYAATDLYERMNEKFLAREAVKKALRAAYRTNSTKTQRDEDRVIEEPYTLISELGSDVAAAAGFQMETTHSYTGDSYVSESEYNASLARELVSEGKQKPPSKTSDEFLNSLMYELTGGGSGYEKPIDHQDILDMAISEWNNRTDFDFGANEGGLDFFRDT